MQCMLGQVETENHEGKGRDVQRVEHDGRGVVRNLARAIGRDRREEAEGLVSANVRDDERLERMWFRLACTYMMAVR